MDKIFILRGAALGVLLALVQVSRAAGEDDLLFNHPMLADAARVNLADMTLPSASSRNAGSESASPQAHAAEPVARFETGHSTRVSQSSVPAARPALSPATPVPAYDSATAGTSASTARPITSGAAAGTPPSTSPQRLLLPSQVRQAPETEDSYADPRTLAEKSGDTKAAMALSSLSAKASRQILREKSINESIEEGDEQTMSSGASAFNTSPRSSGTASAAIGKNNATIHSWFQQMVGLALEHSPEVRGAMSDLDASDWGIKQVKGQRYPQVEVGSNAPFGTFGSGRGTHHNNSINDTSASVSVTTNIFDWGKISADLDSAKEDMNASEQQVKETRENIASTTMTELLNLSRYKESIKVAKAYVRRMNELTNMLTGIANVDKGRVSEMVQAQARLLAAQAEEERLQHLYDNTRIKLVRLMGTEPTLIENIRWDGGLMPLSTALGVLPEHPTLLRAEAEIRAAGAQAESIKADGLPKLNWVISKSTAKDENGDENAWYTGLSVQWNAFSGGSNRAARQAALAKMRSAQEKAQTSRYELEYQIRNMVETRDSSLVRANNYVRLTAETDRVRDMFFRQWYNLGTRTLLDVLTAESDHFNNQLSAINNFYDGYVSNVTVMYNAGILLRWLANLPIKQPKTSNDSSSGAYSYHRQHPADLPAIGE